MTLKWLFSSLAMNNPAFRESETPFSKDTHALRHPLAVRSISFFLYRCKTQFDASEKDIFAKKQPQSLM
jgi:hypothetical protein